MCIDFSVSLDFFFFRQMSEEKEDFARKTGIECILKEVSLTQKKFIIYVW